MLRWAWVIGICGVLACGDDDGGGGSDAGSRVDAGGGRDEDAGGGDDGGSGGGDGGMMMGGDETPAEFRFCDAPGTGTVIEAGPSDYRDHVGTLGPGDTLRLAAGMYPDGLTIQDLAGEEDDCIVIEGPTDGGRAVFLGSDSRNTISIRDSSYVVIRNLEVDGQGRLGDGLKAEGDAMFAHHIVVDGLYIHDLSDDMQIVGINTKTPAWRWVIRNNHIVSAGTGLYLGGSSGNTPFIGGLIERNVGGIL